MDTLSAEPAVAVPARDARDARARLDRLLGSARAHWVDIAWIVFIVGNVLAMRFITVWQTVPFLAIWVSLTTVYGFRLWKLGSTLLTTAVVTLVTGGLIG